ncbi:FMN-linked oxidoreductase [Panus rudis PR-1116 ss-1]|nr:FMN-linked oxidoreductase [Panus rudis PR-1116 ss-1]
MASPRLFQHLKVGNVQLEHRVVMSPLTRYRADKNHVPHDFVETYYKQRASTPGTLIITEATIIAPQAGGYDNVPGLYTKEQLDAWKKIVHSVHARNSFIFSQLWALGRTADPSVLARNGFPHVAPSDIPLTGREVKPRPFTIDEIKEFVQLHAKAASNAVNVAGFDGVELHGANGYLIDQFIQDVSNHRQDEYGGSIENRARFVLEVIDAVVKEVGENKVGIRLSPWRTFQDMRMQDPIPTFSYLVKEIAARWPNFAYIHVIEPRFDYQGTEIPAGVVRLCSSNDFLRDIWGSRPYIAAAGFNRPLAIDTVEDKGGLVAFGRDFISNPDLPLRLKLDIPLTPWDVKTFYKAESRDGYIDYPFAEETGIAV